jgi:hypothetical protein
MAQQVVNGALLQCTFGVAPSTFMVLPKNRVNCCNMPAANIMDYIPLTNIMPFGMCTTVSNPQVAAATSAALGVLTPVPCIPVVPAPWVPGAATVLIGNMPALDNISTCTCTWGGVITITSAGQVTVNIP